MSLLAFINYMTDHPDEMAAYKRDPQAFFEKHPDIALTGGDQSALQKLAFGPAMLEEETTTVFRVAIRLGQDPAASISAASHTRRISLDGVKVNIYAHSEAHVFFAEPQAEILSCTTLRHSYLHIPDKQNIYFDLHLCCTDPEDETDRPQVLYIRTAEAARPLDVQPYANNTVIFNISPVSVKPWRPGYILAVAEGAQYLNNPVSLGWDSWYEPDTGSLQLCFDNRPKPQ